jgi:hypothetical protein
MICGHIGIAMGARARSREVPLGWLVAGSLAPDILDVCERLWRVCSPHGLYSHSLPVVAMLAVGVSAAAFLHVRTGNAAMLVGLMVILHLLTDYVTGQKLLWAGGPLVGLDLYRWPLADFALELPVIALGWWMLRRAAIDPRWVTSWFALAALLAVQAAFNISQLKAIRGPAGPHCEDQTKNFAFVEATAFIASSARAR